MFYKIDDIIFSEHLKKSSRESSGSSLEVSYTAVISASATHSRSLSVFAVGETTRCGQDFPAYKQQKKRPAREQ